MIFQKCNFNEKVLISVTTTMQIPHLTVVVMELELTNI